jgi:hypothetical protein
LGALTLAGMRPLDGEVGLAIAGAFEHHLKTDLSGYPKLSRPRTLHLFSRIISVCDAFDAMTSGRVYQKETISPDEAIRRLLYKGREWFDPLVLKAFVHVVGVFPVGTAVKLSDGSIAVVTKNDSADLYSPEVLIIRDAAGEPMRKAKELRVKKRQSDPGSELHIDTVIDPRAEGINVQDYLGVMYQPADSGAIPIPAVEA